MTILSVNASLEQELLSDQGFLYSHLADYLTLLSATQVSGHVLEPYIIGRKINTYESIGQGSPINLVLNSIAALDQIVANPEKLSTLDSLQSVLSTDLAVRPILGLPALLMLAHRLDMDVKSGNILKELSATEDISDVFELPCYTTYLDHEFCADMSDVDSVSEIEEVSKCLYVPLYVCPSSEFNTQFVVVEAQADWAYRLIRNYTQGHYDLRLACATATKNVYVFSIIAAAMLGIDAAKVESYSDTSNYDSLSDAQKYEMISTIKPLLENIAFDFSNDDLISL